MESGKGDYFKISAGKKCTFNNNRNFDEFGGISGPNGILFSYHDLIRYFCAEKVWGSSVITFNLKH